MPSLAAISCLVIHACSTALHAAHSLILAHTSVTRLPHVPRRFLQGTASAARVSIEDPSPRLSPGSQPTLASGNAAAQASLRGAPNEFVRAQRSVPTLQPSAAEQLDLGSSHRSQSMMMDALGSRSPIGDMPVVRQWGELRRSGTARLRMTMQRSAFTSDFSSPGSSSARDVDSNVLRRKLVRSTSVTRAARADVRTPHNGAEVGSICASCTRNAIIP